MDKLKAILSELYCKIDVLYFKLSDLDCDLFVTEQMESQIKEVLSLYDQFKQEISALHKIDWDNTEGNNNDLPITLLSPIIDAWALVQAIDEQIFNGKLNMRTLKEFDNIMGQLRFVRVGLLV